MTHLFVDLETKESLKALFQFTQVTFCVVADKDFKVISAGNPKDLDIAQSIAQTESNGATLGGLALDEDF